MSNFHLLYILKDFIYHSTPKSPQQGRKIGSKLNLFEFINPGFRARLTILQLPRTKYT